MLEQTERVWSRLCQEKVTHLSRMLTRLAALVTKHEDAQRQLVLGELRRSPEQRRAQAELLRDSVPLRAALSTRPGHTAGR
ncbi:MAG: hypothetical protein EHM78_25195 [Myxococcaceae bacterium]|nr:MAG: hypothetical protein EHM78_25195 [Myxococcaceae bacterium]